MRKKVILTLPLGFTTVNRVDNVSIWRAEEILTTRRSRLYTKAVRHSDRAELYSPRIVCPYCEYEVRLNTESQELVGGMATVKYRHRISASAVREWATRQMSLFDVERDAELLLTKEISPPAVFKCPECEGQSFPSRSARRVELELRGKKAIIKSEISEIDEILSLPWVKTDELHIYFPVCEVVTFDLGRGAVYVKIVDSSGAIISHRDVSGCPELLEGGAVNKVLCESKRARRELRRLFELVWEAPLPFVGKRLDIEAFFKMTAFVGYPERFYNGIPYTMGSIKVEKSFRPQARRLHLAKNIDNTYRLSGLPNVKSVRRDVFNDAGLLFYSEELVSVFRALSDTNLFCRFIRCDRVYEILSELRVRPGIIDYITDYAAEMGAKSVVISFEREWDGMLGRAVDYGCMSARMRRQVREGWRDQRHPLGSFSRASEISIPMCNPDESIRDVTVDGYSFFWLRCSNDYLKASKSLNNCLATWNPGGSPVVCVGKNGSTVAAIEIYDRKVIQARGVDNIDIDDDEELCEAVSKWMRKYRLEWADDDYEAVAF